MTQVGHLRVVSPEQRLTARDAARAELRKQLQRLKPTAKETILSQGLMGALEELTGPHDLHDKAIRIVNNRISRLKKVKRPLTSIQRRQLLMIIFFGESRYAREIDQIRHDACAILQLHGKETDIEKVCAVYPGLRTAFEN